MYARSTTVRGEPGRLGAGIEHVREVVLPRVREIEGCQGLSLLADPATGRCIATTAWADMAAMLRSEEAVAPLRAEAAAALGGPAEVHEWELAWLHRDHRARERACCRVTWLDGDPDALDELVEHFGEEVLPRLEDLSGFCSASILLDRDAGRSAVTVSWDSPRAMTASRAAATVLRVDTVEGTRMRVDEVAEFELALAHLDVPEVTA